MSGFLSGSTISCYGPQSERGEENPGCVFEDLVGQLRGQLQVVAESTCSIQVQAKHRKAARRSFTLSSLDPPTHTRAQADDQQNQLKLPENCTETGQEGRTVHTSHVSGGEDCCSP